jgi:hypothetical protein
MKDPIFADFEKNEKGEFFLLSVRYDGLTTTYILDERLEPLADSKLSQDFNLVVMTPKQAVEQLVERCEERACPLAAYSRTEKDSLRDDFGIEVSCYLDMHKLAKKWVNKYHKKEFEQLPTYKPKSKDRQIKTAMWSLMAFGKWLDLGLPSKYGRGKVTARVEAIIGGFKARGADYEVLTGVQKRKAGDLLRHNVFDVEGPEKLLKIISAEDARLVSRILSR